MCGYRNEHLEARWYQLGAFSPINRLHSTIRSSWAGTVEFLCGDCATPEGGFAATLRHMMLPYKTTMNYRAAFEEHAIGGAEYWADPNNHVWRTSVPDTSVSVLSCWLHQLFLTMTIPRSWVTRKQAAAR